MKKILHIMASFFIVMFIAFTFNGQKNIVQASSHNITVKVVVDNADEYKDVDHKVNQSMEWIRAFYKRDNRFIIKWPTVGKICNFNLKNNEQKTFRVDTRRDDLKLFNIKPYSNSDYHYSLTDIEYESNIEDYKFLEGTKYEISTKTTFKLKDRATIGSVVLHYKYNPDIEPIKKEPPNPICTKQVDYLGDGHINKDTKKDGKNNYRMYLDFITQKEVNSNKANIIFVADTSGSIGEDGMAQYQSILKNSFKSLIENPDNRISLITFSTEAELKASNTNDLSKLNDGVDSLKAEGNTGYYGALQLTQQEINKLSINKEEDRETVVIFLTDGSPDKSIDSGDWNQYTGITYAYDIASKLKGISRFFSIFMSSGSEGATQLQNLTQLVNTEKPTEKIMVQASKNEDVRYALDEFFKRLGNGLSNAQLVDEFSDYVILDGDPEFKATSSKDEQVKNLVVGEDYEIITSSKGITFKLLTPTVAQTKYSFSYNARPSDKAFDYRYEHNSFPNVGEENTDYKDNKTSSLKQGLFAQNETKIVFNYGKGEVSEKVFPKPVIQVLKPEAIDIPITFTKKLEGQTLKKDMFTFNLYNKNNRVIETVKNDDCGNVEFDSVVIDSPGKYSYVAKEKIPYQKGTYTYDNSKKKVDVNVVRRGDYLKSYITYPKERSFINKYTPRPAFVSLTVNKILENGTLKDKQFKFQLVNHKNDLIGYTYNNAYGKVPFSPIKITESGEYKYNILEVVPESPDPNMKYDTKVIKVGVEVKDIGGQLSAEVTYLNDDITFKNKYEYKPITAGIQTKVVLTGMRLSNGLFDFEMKEIDKDNKPIGKTIFKASNSVDRKIIFNCNFKTVGTHHYEVKQIIPDKKMKNMKYDEEPVYLDVEVVDKGNGIIEAVTTPKEKKEFCNEYKILGEIW